VFHKAFGECELAGRRGELMIPFVGSF